MSGQELQPTLAFQPVVDTPAAHDPSRGQSPCAGLLAGSGPSFASETARLLHTRLRAAVTIMLFVLVAAVVGSFLSGTFTMWGLRCVVIGITAVWWWVLGSGRQFSYSTLRAFELLIFGLIVAQLSLVQWTRIGQLALVDDGVGLTAVRFQYLGAWCLVILIYGIFIPNSWQRAGAMLFAVACLPYALYAAQVHFHPQILELSPPERVATPLPLPFAAAAVGVYAAHIIHATRQSEFKSRQFGQYRLLEQLGSGGMGVVYKAEHTLLKRACAIKLIRPECEADARAVTRFEREVRVMARLTHWNTVEIYDYGRTEDGAFYYVMELLPGLSLDQLMAQSGPLEPARVVYLLRQVCAALAEAHDIGLIHRDLKPANIFASQRGGAYDVAKLLDFGLVREQQSAPAERAAAATHPAANDEPEGVSGTPSYMAPEQALTYDQVDPRGDLYALGAVAYHLLTGQPPFTRDTVLATIAAHAQAPVTPPSQLIASIPSDLEQVVLRCLAKQPEQRYASAGELERALAGCECAAAWNAELAAAWWQRYSTTPQQAGPPTQTANDETLAFVQSPQS